MSTSPESNFDVEKLFLPAWAQESPTVNKYASFAGEERREGRDFDRAGGRRPPRRDFNRGPGGPGGAGGSRGPGGSRPQGQSRGPERSSDPRRRSFQGREDAAPRREPPEPAPQIDMTIMPDEKGTESLARQIRITGRAYPLFDIAHLILQKPERQQVRFDVIKKQGGGIEQPMFLCALDDSLWLSEDEAVEHVLNRHFDTFYKAERTQTDPPKGTYTFVAQCGISGAVLGPPNYHDYQTQLRKLHAERFSRMPFEDYKARVKIVRDEAIVKKWIEDQSFKTEYVCLNVPEPRTLASREEVEKHFREVHKAEIIKSVESHTMSGPAARQLRSPALQRLLRSVWEDQRRFPLKLATTLSQQFAAQGLQFFKVNRTVTHVSVARPHFLDMSATPVSEGVKKIVDFINATPKCTRRKLMEALAPAPAAPAVPAVPAPAVAGETPAAPAAEVATPEQTAVNSDLHWLVHQGHVIEFANGILETAKKPLPKPPKPEPKSAPEATPAAESTDPIASAEGSAAVAPAEAAALESAPVTPAEPASEAPAQQTPAV